jgi:uncharacterized Zn finger protein
VNAPGSIYIECPVCGEETLHRVIKGRVSEKNGAISFEGVVKCSVCGNVHNASIKEDKKVKVRAIISEGEESKKTFIELYPNDMVMVDDEFMVEGMRVKIRAIETEEKRVESAPVHEIKTIWLKRYDKLKVKFSINKKDRTVSKSILASPDEEFYIGDSLKIDRDYVVIHRIKAEWGIVRKGGVQARDIVRVYGKKID